MSNNAENLENMKERLESLRSENHQLTDLLADKKKEIKSLSSLVSNAVEKLLEVETNLLTTIADLKCSTEDAHIEASIMDDLYNFLLKELVGQIKCFVQESHIEHDIMLQIYEVIFRETSYNAEPPSKLEIEDTDVESIIMQGVFIVVLQEALKESKEELDNLNAKYIKENEVRLSLEKEAREKEKSLTLKIAGKEKLEQEIHLMTATIDEKDKMVQEATEALAKEQQQFRLASQELDNLRAQMSHQQMLISKGSEESQVIKGDLDEALQKICELQEGLEEKQSLIEMKEKEHRKQMDSIIVLVHELSKAVTEFECRAAGYIKNNSLRLENLSSQLSSLIQMANRLSRTGFLYKQRLESRSSDLQKAEAEVDLLGDEVNTLRSLLEKIYIALDHYSPILQHYPGIIETLKLIRRQLSGDSIKPV